MDVKTFLKFFYYCHVFKFSTFLKLKKMLRTLYTNYTNINKNQRKHLKQ